MCILSFSLSFNKFHEKGVADEAAVRRAEIAAKTAKQRSRHNRASHNSNVTVNNNEVTRKNLRRTATTRAAIQESDEDEEDDNEIGKILPVPEKNTRTTRARARTRIVFSSDDGDNE